MLYWLFALAVALGLFYYWSTNTFAKWLKVPNLKVAKPWPLIGSYKFLPGSTSTTELGDMIYRDFKDVGYGLYFSFKEPVFVVTDPELLKSILVKDFDHFQNRNVFDAINEASLVSFSTV